MDKGLKILMNAYWGRDGWKKVDVSKEDFEIAKSEGYMFDPPKPLNHDETINRIQELCSQITPEQVSNAFLYSLSTRKLEYRSILSSYWFGLAIADHESDGKAYCSYCNWSFHDFKCLNAMNFERYKWGGVRYNNAVFVLFDLEQFLKLPPVIPTETDKQIFRDILHCVDELEPNKKAGRLRDIISKKKIFKTNKDEITTILEILSVCGVLSSERVPCYYDNLYVDTSPIEHTNDMVYPLNRWRKEDGINLKWLKKIFGENFKL